MAGICCFVFLGLFLCVSGSVPTIRLQFTHRAYDPYQKFKEIQVFAGDNVTLDCPGVHETSLISNLVWRSNRLLVDYSNGQTNLWAPQERFSLTKQFGLLISPLMFRDSGDYACLVNSRPTTDFVISMLVQEEQKVNTSLLHQMLMLTTPTPLTDASNKTRRGIIYDYPTLPPDVPQPPGRPLVLSFTSRTVDLSWAPSAPIGKLNIIEYLIETKFLSMVYWNKVTAKLTLQELNQLQFTYSVGRPSNWTASPLIVLPGTRSFYFMDGLLPYHIYSFRVYAINALGVSQPSEPSFFTVTLRELPSVKPTIITAAASSPTTVILSWSSPPNHTLHGEFLGFRITYKERVDGNTTCSEFFIQQPGENTFRDLMMPSPYNEQQPSSPYNSTCSEFYVRDSTHREITTITVDNLEVFTQYLFGVSVINPEGTGPAALAVVMTDETYPEKAEDLTVLEDLITSTIIYLNWTEPKKINGEIEGYRIFFLTNNLTDVQTVKAEDGEGMDHSKPIPLQHLKPFTHYRIWVKGFTRKNEGNSSAIVSARTDIAPPSAPDILNITCKSPDTLYFKWARPEVYYNTIDYYDVFIRNDFDSSITEIQFNTSIDHLDFAALIPNLTIDTVYEVKVRASTYSTVHKNLLKEGPYSDPKTILMHLECDQFHLIAKDSSVHSNSVVLTSLGAVGGGILVACAAFILWRKCFHAAYYYLDDVPGQAPPTLMDWDAPPLENPPQDGPSRYAIPVSMFPRHVANLHADGDIGFSKEYESIQAESNQEDFASEQSQHPENKTKNRYLNIIAYDHTRVQLSPVPGHKKGYDYVNANYIDGFQCSRAYIGTQGPLPSTFDCFWRMVWEQRVTIIVMITNLVERGRRKCDLYWPKEGSETYGVIQVKLLREDVMATYTVRTLVIKHLRKKKGQVSEKIVFQYHYTNWPDHGTPDHPLPVLSFVKKSAAANPPGSGPIIVHCSAGVGRTGTYIVLDAMLKQIQKHGVVNIYGFLRHIRSQRNFLVQTEEQYIFIHDALLEAIESGETNVMRENLESYVESLRTENPKGDCSIQWHLLEEQYKLLTSFQPRDFNLVAANKNYNSHKNRVDSNLPLEISRVHLTPKPGIDGSDYINATWLQGFQRLREFIITQHPLQETVFDFWQMIWDHSCQTIALLTLIDAQEYDIFWPTENCNIETANYRVKLVLEQDLPACVARDFVMQSLTDDYELNVRILQCSGWPHFSQPQYDLFEFLKVVQESNCRNPNSPVVVIDRNGGTEAGTFCVLTALAMHLEYENFADVYMYAKLFHNKRPGVWRNSSDYLFLYSSIKCISPDTQLLPQHPQPIIKPPITPEEPDSFPMTTLNGSTVGFQAATSDVEPEASIEIHQIISDVKDSPA